MSRKKAGESGAVVERPPEVLEVLKESTEARKKFYKDYRTAHRNIIAVAEELLQLISEPADAEVIYLIGPTGSGKTTVTEYVISKLEEMALPTIDKFPGHVPAAYIVAQSPDKGAYDWGEHYVNTLLALEEVLIDKKVYLPGPYDGVGALRKGESPRRAAQRRAAENALMNRILYAFFVDEAQYIIKRKSGEGLMDQADTIRSLAARSKTLHVLSGTYDLRHLRNLNGQLGRRSHTVRFRPYCIEGLTRDEQVSEVKAFTEAFMSLQAYLPVDEQPDLVRHVEFCFTRCVGCVGHLKSWFRRSLSMALEGNCKTITSELFLKATPKKEVWNRIVQEIAEGEEALDEKDEELEYELHKLEHVNNPSAARPENNDAGTGGKAKKGARSGKGTSSKSRKGRRPFTPNPERYPVGMNENAG